MVDLATGTEAIDFLIDGARYGDMDDVEIALDQYKVGVDATDEQQRTGNSIATYLLAHIEPKSNKLPCAPSVKLKVRNICLEGKEEV